MDIIVLKMEQSSDAIDPNDLLIFARVPDLFAQPMPAKTRVFIDMLQTALSGRDAQSA